MNEIIEALAIDAHDPRRLYAGSTVSGLYTSADAGKSWSAVLLGYRDVSALAVDPTAPGVAYAGTRSWGGGTRDARVYRSADFGASWKPARDGFGEGAIHAVVVEPGRSRNVWAATDDGVFKSTDGGRTWSRSDAAAAETALPPAAVEREARPTLAGSAVGDPYSIVAHPTRPGTAYAATTKGVFETTDTGRSWVAFGLEGDAITGGLAVARSLPNTIYALESFGGLRKTTDRGATWVQMGLHSQDVAVVGVAPNRATTVYAGTRASFPGAPSAFPDATAGIFKSIDGGVSWALAGRLPSVNALAIDPRSDGRVYAGTDAGVFTSANGGATWRRTSRGLCVTRRSQCTVLALAVDPADPDTLYAGTEKGTFKSSDGGKLWRGLGTKVTGWRIGAITVDPTAPGTVYVGSSGAPGPAGVFRSADGGRTWRPLGHGVGDQGVSALAVDRNGGTVYVSHDEGVLAIDVK